MRSAPQKQPSPKMAVSNPGGKGPCRGVPSTSCRAGIANGGAGRPGRAPSGSIIVVFLRPKSRASSISFLHFAVCVPRGYVSSQHSQASPTRPDNKTREPDPKFHLDVSQSPTGASLPSSPQRTGTGTKDVGGG